MATRRKRWKGKNVGRPRSAKIRRRKWQNKIINDPPTPEFMAHRLALAGGGEQRGCGYPLGVMLTRKWTTRADHDAGLDFARLYRQKNGATAATCTTLEAGGGSADDLGAFDRRFLKGIPSAAEYRAAKRALLQCGREVAEAVEGVAVFENMGLALDDGRREPVRRGLARLKRHFRRG